MVPLSSSSSSPTSLTGLGVSAALFALTALVSLHRPSPSPSPSTNNTTSSGRARIRGVMTSGVPQSVLEPSLSVDSYPAEIRAEIFSRIRAFFGDAGFAKLTDANVVVVGLGGVGSHAANMLVRSGVGRVRLIDFDQVTLSSLNRHAMASLAEVGLSKAEVMRRRLQQVVPWARIDAVTEMFRGVDAERLLLVDGKHPTYVLDCIDDVNTKAELIAFCVQRGIPILTSMGESDLTE
jgi:tRNA A37 threonylcarbamoyladenosine dehydratase